MALVQKAFSDIITFSRSSNATRIGPTGLVEYAPHNLLVQSQTFGTTWTQTRTSVTSNLVAAPDGTVTADAFYDSAGSGGQPVISQGVTTTAQRHTFSVYAKYLNKQWIRLTTSLFSFGTTYFDIQNGVIGSVNANHTASISNVGNGWYRIAISFESTASSVTFYLEGAGGNGVPSYTPVAGEGYYIWGAQLAVGPYALDYTPTTSAAVYGPRFDYDPVTLAARGLLIEEQRTNSCLQSADFTTTWSAANRVSITSNIIVAPDGTLTGDKLIADTTASSTHYVVQNTGSIAAPWTFSCYAKAGEYSRVGFSYSNTGYVFFNLSTGVQEGTVGGGITSTSITSVGNGWYRISFTSTSTASGANIGIYLFNSAYSSGVPDFTGDGTSGLYIWGAQAEAGSFATSYIPTVASTVTRSADVASVNTLSPWYSSTEGTLFAEFSSSGVSYGSIASLFTDANNLISLVAGPSGSGFVMIDGGSVQVAIGTRSYGSKQIGAYKLNDFATSTNGGAVDTDTSGTVPTITSLGLGNENNGSFMNGHLRRVAFYPRRLTNAELQALTA